MEKLFVENKSLCAKCGGKCCIKCGCTYLSHDFETMQLNYLLSKLEEGYISIIALADISSIGGKIVLQPFLYLRARNIDRPIVDLISPKNTCMSLTQTGCQYSDEDRPSIGRGLVPKENGECEQMYEEDAIRKSWMPYQNVLMKLVKKLTGKSVYEKLKEDAENLFYSWIMDGFMSVANEQARIEMLQFMPLLKQIYPEEFKKAHQKAGYSPIRVRNIK